VKKKAILVIIDGLADKEIPQLEDQSTFAYARHDNLDHLAQEGIHGYMDACPSGFIPESMVCILNILGIDKAHFPPSRASLEIRSMGYSLADNEVVLRCNLVAIDHQNRIVSFNGGSLSKEEMKTASQRMGDCTSPVRFLPMAEYRNLLVLDKKYFNRLGVATFPPHECLGESVEELLDELFASSQQIRDFVWNSAERLKGLKKGELTYLFYPWGISERDDLPAFSEKYNRKAAAVCAADIARGIALGLGMDVPNLNGVTGDTDTDLLLKAKTACSLLKDYEFVFVHINGTDEASHRKDYMEKVRFIERIDEEFIGYLLANVESDTQIMICTDHATHPVDGKHAHLPVPFFLRGTGKENPQAVQQILTPKDALVYLLADK